MQRLAFAALAAAMIVASCAHEGPPPSPVADAATVRTVAQGDVVGFTQTDGAHVWQAIPYAAAPVGDLRWRAPRAAVKWTGTREAIAEAPRCPQVTNGLDRAEGLKPGRLIGEEDCLFLSVYAPADAKPGADLPVMVWIHGGANVWGHMAGYDGGRMAEAQNVIVVTVQYRIGPLGWFALEDMRATAQTPDDRSANFGTLDLISALEWTRDNISVFGGDAGNVTIYGESAGGHNVASLLASPRAKGLFHKAIIESGVFRTESLPDAEGVSGDLVNAADEVVERLGLAGAPDLAAKLRSLDLKTLFAGYDVERIGFMKLPRVIADGVVLPENGIAGAFSTPGEMNDVPVITGANRDEMKLFNALDKTLVKMWFGVLPAARDLRYYEVSSEYQSRIWRALAIDLQASRVAGAGHADVWTYRFDWDEEGRVLTADLSRLLGAAHSMEIPFVFGRFKQFGSLDKVVFRKQTRDSRRALSDAMMSYWAQFAYAGDPGRGRDGTLPEWGRWSEAGDKTIVFDTPADGGVRMTGERETLAQVLAAMQADPRFRDADERCRAFNVSADAFPDIEPARAAFLNGGCPKP